jgi:hypothetical protein
MATADAAGRMAVTTDGRRYGYVSKIEPLKMPGIVFAGSASAPPIIGPDSVRLVH